MASALVFSSRPPAALCVAAPACMLLLRHTLAVRAATVEPPPRRTPPALAVESSAMSVLPPRSIAIRSAAASVARRAADTFADTFTDACRAAAVGSVGVWVWLAPPRAPSSPRAFCAGDLRRCVSGTGCGLARAPTRSASAPASSSDGAPRPIRGDSDSGDRSPVSVE